VYVYRGMCMCIGVCVSVEGYVHVYRGICM
jgi:hypothetical protein